MRAGGFDNERAEAVHPGIPEFLLEALQVAVEVAVFLEILEDFPNIYGVNGPWRRGEMHIHPTEILTAPLLSSVAWPRVMVFSMMLDVQVRIAVIYGGHGDGGRCEAW
jgi:hypothetical protein